MAINNPYAAYQNNSVTTSSPGELTLMLYNGCLKFIQQGKMAIEKGDIEAKNTAIQKAQAIVTELMITLDTSYPVSKNMMILYDFVSNRLLEANIKNDPKLLEEASGIITEFRDTWKQVIQLDRQQKYANVSEV